MKKPLKLAICLALACSSTACLKTRAQLREDGGTDDHEQSRPIPAQVQDVRPKDSYVIDELKSEITRMNGRIEDLERHNQQTQAASSSQSNARAEDLKKLEARLAQLEQSQAALMDAVKRAQAAPTAPVDSSEYLNKGKAQLQNGDLEGAIESLSKVVGSSNSKHAEEATFLRGEAYFEMKNYKKAIVDYSRFPEKYSQSKRMPTALYKIGLSFDALGMKDDAKGFYQELIEKHPKSQEAKKAKSKMKG